MLNRTQPFKWFGLPERLAENLPSSRIARNVPLADRISANRIGVLMPIERVSKIVEAIRTRFTRQEFPYHRDSVDGLPTIGRGRSFDARDMAQYKRRIGEPISICAGDTSNGREIIYLRGRIYDEGDEHEEGHEVKDHVLITAIERVISSTGRKIEDHLPEIATQMGLEYAVAGIDIDFPFEPILGAPYSSEFIPKSEFGEPVYQTFFVAVELNNLFGIDFSDYHLKDWIYRQISQDEPFALNVSRNGALSLEETPDRLKVEMRFRSYGKRDYAKWAFLGIGGVNSSMMTENQTLVYKFETREERPADPEREFVGLKMECLLRSDSLFDDRPSRTIMLIEGLKIAEMLVKKIEERINC